MATPAAFNYFASLEDQGQQEIRHVRVEQELQAELNELFTRQRDELISAEEEVPFDGRYQPTEDEVFFIEDFPLPADILAAIQKPASAPPLDRATSERWDALKSFFAGRSPAGKAEVVFQAFDRRRSLAHSRSIVIRKETFARLDDPGIILDNRAAAVFKNERLYFRSYINARRVLDLSQYYRTATDADVRNFTKLPQLAFENAEQFIALADAPIRRKIALIGDSKILETVPPGKMQTAASAYGLALAVKAGRVVVPADKKALKTLLRFLEENYFTSDLTGTRFLTSSKRPIGK